MLEAQRRAIESVAPGVSFEAVHEEALRVLVDGLRELGAVGGSTDEVIQQGTYRSFYMHRTSHWLGMDVHDVGKYRSPDRPPPPRAGDGADRRAGTVFCR